RRRGQGPAGRPRPGLQPGRRALRAEEVRRRGARLPRGHQLQGPKPPRRGLPALRRRPVPQERSRRGLRGLQAVALLKPRRRGGPAQPRGRPGCQEATAAATTTAETEPEEPTAEPAAEPALGRAREPALRGRQEPALGRRARREAGPEER